ncbi:MAG TPA: hypothetical protein VFW56_10855 [Bradyrhizobium sp.]|nr:hypothetical protein [Bradyrhizobium sp.]
MNGVRRAFALFLVLLAGAAVAQVPPPPPLAGQDELTRQLVADFKSKNVNAYAALLSDQVQVYEDGKLIARNKREWMHRFGPELSAKGVTFELTPGFSSTGRLLFIEYFNSMASWGQTPPPDCCWGYNAVAYDIQGDKIVTIRRLTGGAIRLDPDGNPR